MKKKRNKKEDDVLPKALRKNNSTNKKKKKKFKLKLALCVLVLIIVLSIFELLSLLTWKNLSAQMLKNTSSQVVDSSEDVIAELGSEKINIPIEFSQIPQDLKNAYVAIEDQRFYKHHGIDVKRTASAIVSYVIHFGSAKFGGSTITQQLVKNMTGEDSNTISRKVSEWFRAFILEAELSKDEIIGAYLNIIYVGPNVYGVQAGSNYYFNKDVKDLSLAECAFLAGINNSPNSYNPFGETSKTEKITKRTKTVLKKMLELKYISEESYNTAIAEVEAGFKFKKGAVKAQGNGVYSYHTDALVAELVDTFSSKNNISSTFATNYLNMAGLKIYSTQDSNIQDKMEDEFKEKKYILYSKNDSGVTSQSAMVIVNHKNGQVVGCVGGLGEKKEARSLNRAVQSARQTGSAIKPLAILGPALQENIITPVTMFDDSPANFDIGKPEPYQPIDYDQYLGTITVRRAVESSQNIPFVLMMEQLTPAKSVKYMKKLGITTLTSEDVNLPLALGGLEKGMTPLETASAYATIANDGIYITPVFFSKVEDSGGNVILQPHQKQKRVFSEATCYVLKQLLTQPVKGTYGTATYCSISGMDVCAKTGTTNDNYDRWLCGFTPYYTAVTWYGFDKNESINYSGNNPAGVLWASVMNRVHKKLANAKFVEPKSGVSSYTVCPETGKLANSKCPNRYTEYFITGTEPEMCTLHK